MDVSGIDVSGIDVPARQIPLTLDDAVRLGWKLAPDVQEADLSVLGSEGIRRVRSSEFDGQFDLDLTFDFSRLELTPTVFEALVSQREDLESVIADLNQTADNLEAQLAESDSRVLIECSEDLIIFIDDQPICNSVGNIDTQSFDDLLVDLLGLDLGLDADLIEEISDTSNESLAQARQAVEETIIVLRSAADDTQETRDLLGDAPRHDETATLNLAVSWTKTYRNGITWTPALTWTGVETNYAGKEKSATLGGKGIVNTHSTVFSSTWSLPLREGRGRRITTALERAAELDVRAAEATARRTLEQRTASVVSAFRSLAYAEERVALRREATRRQERYVDIGNALITARQAPEIDARRVAATQTSARRALLSAERQRRVARLTLMDALGVEFPGFALHVAPLVEELPSRELLTDLLRPGVPLQLLVRESLERRHDLSAARFRRDAQILRRAVADDKLRRAVDLDLALGYQGLEEEASFGDGFYGALTRDVPGLSATFQIQVEWPPRTRVDVGALLQEEATLDRLDIALQEQERSIGSRIVSLAGRLQRAVSEAYLAEQAVELHQQIARSQIELYQAGEATLRDTLLTEDRLTATRLTLLDARFEALELLTQLHLEAGVLVTWRDGLPEVESLDSLDPLLLDPSLLDGGLDV